MLTESCFRTAKPVATPTTTSVLYRRSRRTFLGRSWFGGVVVGFALIGGGSCAPERDGAFSFSSGDPVATCEVPDGPWGVSPGRLQQPWTVSDCDGNAYSLYNEDFCRARATVVVLSAGWCGVCRDEAPSMFEELVAPYKARGVRVMQVLQQDERYRPAGADFCRTWASEYGTEGMTFVDPERTTSTYTYRPGLDEDPPSSNSNSLPVVHVYDATGTIRNVLEGGTDNWSAVTEALDVILGE
jgi:hypothetical protein